jgi:hypothetical protein
MKDLREECQDYIRGQIFELSWLKELINNRCIIGLKNEKYVSIKTVQDYSRKNGLQVGSDFYGALDKKIEQIVESATKRATCNMRRTLKSYDL